MYKHLTLCIGLYKQARDYCIEAQLPKVEHDRVILNECRTLLEQYEKGGLWQIYTERLVNIQSYVDVHDYNHNDDVMMMMMVMAVMMIKSKKVLWMLGLMKSFN
jgi:hypothetical protein